MNKNVTGSTVNPTLELRLEQRRLHRLTVRRSGHPSVSGRTTSAVVLPDTDRRGQGRRPAPRDRLTTGSQPRSRTIGVHGERHANGRRQPEGGHDARQEVRRAQRHAQRCCGDVRRVLCRRRPARGCRPLAGEDDRRAAAAGVAERARMSTTTTISAPVSRRRRRTCRCTRVSPTPSSVAVSLAVPGLSIPGVEAEVLRHGDRHGDGHRPRRAGGRRRAHHRRDGVVADRPPRSANGS